MAYSEVQNRIRNMFDELRSKAESIIQSSRTEKEASERIMRVVSSKVSAECEGYLVDIYAEFLRKTKEEEFFKEPENLHRFYGLNLRQQLNEKYHFEIHDLDAYKKGIDYKELNRIYIAAGGAAGTLALGGILKFALASTVTIPIAVIIAGAAAVALAAFFSVNPLKNKPAFRKSVKSFLNDLEKDILNWITDVEIFLEQQKRSLYSVR